MEVQRTAGVRYTHRKEEAVFTEGSVYDPPGDGVQCLVMRTWPRGVVYGRVDVWLKELGPTADLLRGLAGGVLNWAQFAVAYRRQLETRAATQEAVGHLRALAANGQRVTLLCHERSFPCHRFVLLEYLADTT